MKNKIDQKQFDYSASQDLIEYEFINTRIFKEWMDIRQN